MNCPIISLFSKCCCSPQGICLFCTQLTLTVIAIVFGGLIAWKPKKTIDIQIALYRPFNWKIEPISMEKEIKNTRIIGLAAFVVGALSLIYILIK